MSQWATHPVIYGHVSYCPRCITCGSLCGCHMVNLVTGREIVRNPAHLADFLAAGVKRFVELHGSTPHEVINFEVSHG